MTVLAQRGEPFPGSAFERPTYRIPALARTSSGRIVAAFDVRADHNDLPGPFDIAYRVSDDGGRTWTRSAIVRSHDQTRGFGDASLIFDHALGRLWCIYVTSDGTGLWDEDGLELAASYSDDEGEHWTSTAFALDRGEVRSGALFASSGNGIQTSSGRLIQPMVWRPAASTARHGVMALSDDHGQTWRLGSIVNDCDENKVVELDDGRLLLHARATPNRVQAYSCDGGETFSEPMPCPALPDPSCNGGLTRVGSVLVATTLNPNPEPLAPDDDPTRGRGVALAWGKRANLVARVSRDGGDSWTHVATIDPGEAAYSVAIDVGDGRVGVAYERGDYEALAFVVVDPGE